MKEPNTDLKQKVSDWIDKNITIQDLGALEKYYIGKEKKYQSGKRKWKKETTAADRKRINRERNLKLKKSVRTELQRVVFDLVSLLVIPTDEREKLGQDERATKKKGIQQDLSETRDNIKKTSDRLERNESATYTASRSKHISDQRKKLEGLKYIEHLLEVQINDLSSTRAKENYVLKEPIVYSKSYLSKTIVENG